MDHKSNSFIFDIILDQELTSSYLEHLNRLLADLHPSRLEDLDAPEVLEKDKVLKTSSRTIYLTERPIFFGGT